MGSLTDYAENALVKHITTDTAYTPAATVYLALCTADPTDAATVTAGGVYNGSANVEVANAGAYVRKAITFSAAASRRVTASANVTFDAATAGWGAITHWAIVTSATYGSGNVLAHGALAETKTIVTNNIPTISAASIYVEITASTGLTNYAANGFLDRMFRNQAFTVSANYIAAVTATPTDASTGSSITEPSGNNYSRLQVNPNAGSAPKWKAISSNSAVNDGTWSMPTPSGSWGTVTHVVGVDASTAGNALFYGDIADQVLGTSDILQWLDSQFVLSQS